MGNAEYELKILENFLPSTCLTRKSSMDIDDVMNDINKWLEDSDDEAEDDLNEANGDENENEEILPSGQNAS